MKRCKNITGWTDYPIIEIGDISGKKAPIRRIRVLSFDNNKYAKVEILGYAVTVEIKAGYLYSKRGRCGHVKTISFRKLERMIPVVQRELDNCEICKGMMGGVRGNENVINGVVTCDYCGGL